MAWTTVLSFFLMVCMKCTVRWRLSKGQWEKSCVCVCVCVCVKERERVGHIIREIVSPVWVERLGAAVSLQRRSSMRRTQLDTLSSLSGIMGKWEGVVWSLCVRVCVRLAGPGAKLAGDVFSHLTRPTSKCHKWAEIGMKPCYFTGQS